MMETSVLSKLVNAHRQSNLPPNNLSTACTMLLANVGEQDENGIPLKESSKVCYMMWLFHILASCSLILVICPRVVTIQTKQKMGGLAREEEDIEYIALSHSSKETTTSCMETVQD